MKKFIFLFIAILSINFCIEASANTNVYYNNYAVKLSEIGVFNGTENGFELNREPTRLEGLIMLIRLLGKEGEAIKLNSVQCYLTDVPYWGNGYVNYAYKNGLTKGIGNKLFGSNDNIDAQSYITFLLRSLGYDDNINVHDFTWSNSIQFARTIGLLDSELYSKIVSNKFVRDYVAKSSYNALLQPLKDNSMTLIDKLVANGLVSKEQAESLKLVSDSDSALSSVEIGKLANAVVLITADGYDGSQWSGSGFFTTLDGNIVTNFHVIDGAKEIKITENNGDEYTGTIRIIGYDKDKDIAVLDLNKTAPLYLKIGDSDKVILGEEIYTIGSPMGLTNTVSNGIVSSLRSGLIQISAPISHGSSGGVLLNTKGEAIGITSAGIETGENLGFAIPIKEYVNLPKKLNLDLSGLNRSTSKVEKPQNVKLTQISDNEITIYWDKVESADYYRVYIGESENGSFTKLTDSSGSDKYYWSNGYCVSVNGFTPGTTYYVKIVAVNGINESQPSDTLSITLTGKMNYEEYQSYLLKKNKTIYLDNSSFSFDNVTVISTADNSLSVSFNLDNSTFDSFMDIFKYDSSSLAEEMAIITGEIANYYNMDVTSFIVYSQTYTFYPEPFIENNLYKNTITYNSSSKTWFVFYPYLAIDLDYSKNTYNASWAY